jgi:hypothetical protein
MCSSSQRPLAHISLTHDALCCAGKCDTEDNFGKNGNICRIPGYLKGTVPDSQICTNGAGFIAFSQVNVTAQNRDNTNVDTVGRLTLFRTPGGILHATVQMM